MNTKIAFALIWWLALTLGVNAQVIPSVARMGVTPTATPEGLYVQDATGAWVPIGSMNTTSHTFTLTGNVTGNVTGNLTGNVNGRTLTGISVQDPAYGCVGNGIADDTTCVQNAMDSAKSLGLPLLFDDVHQYKISAPGLTSTSNPIDIEGVAPVGNDGISNAQNCLSGLVTDSDITMLYLTNAKVIVRNLCIQMSTVINARTSGAAISLGGPDQQHDIIEGNTIFRPYDGIDLVADSSSSFVRDSFIGHNIIRDATRYGIGHGILGYGGNNVTGITYFDNRVACDAGQTGDATHAIGVAIFDGALTWDQTNIGPSSCYINFEVIPGSVSGHGQNINGQLTGTIGDAAGVHGGATPHELLIEPATSQGVVQFLNFNRAWFGGTTVTDNQVLITNPNNGSINGVLFTGSTFHSANNQGAIPIIDLEGGFNITFVGNQICAWQGGTTTTGVNINFNSAAQGRYTFTGNRIGSCPGATMTNAFNISTNGQAGIIEIDGNDFSTIATPLNYTGVSTDSISIGNNLGLQAASLQTDGSFANPALTASLTGVMMGLGSTLHITPAKSKKALVTITGEIANDTDAYGGQINMYYGTGTAPSNGDAPTGTLCGNVNGVRASAAVAVATQGAPFSLSCVITNLNVNVATWIDIDLKALVGGNAHLYNLTGTVVEQ